MARGIPKPCTLKFNDLSLDLTKILAVTILLSATLAKSKCLSVANDHRVEADTKVMVCLLVRHLRTLLQMESFGRFWLAGKFGHGSGKSLKICNMRILLCYACKR